MWVEHVSMVGFGGDTRGEILGTTHWERRHLLTRLSAVFSRRRVNVGLNAGAERTGVCGPWSDLITPCVSLEPETGDVNSSRLNASSAELLMTWSGVTVSWESVVSTCVCVTSLNMGGVLQVCVFSLSDSICFPFHAPRSWHTEREKETTEG